LVKARRDSGASSAEIFSKLCFTGKVRAGSSRMSKEAIGRFGFSEDQRRRRNKIDENLGPRWRSQDAERVKR
jgi:hypothetical protein